MTEPTHFPSQEPAPAEASAPQQPAGFWNRETDDGLIPESESGAVPAVDPETGVEAATRRNEDPAGPM